jgi:hypothetical protein
VSNKDPETPKRAPENVDRRSNPKKDIILYLSYIFCTIRIICMPTERFKSKHKTVLEVASILHENNVDGKAVPSASVTPHRN